MYALSDNCGQNKNVLNFSVKGQLDNRGMSLID